MDDFRLDEDLDEVGDRLRSLGRRAELNPIHRAQLRRDLMMRHAQVAALGKAGWFGIRARVWKLSSLVATPIVAIAVAFAFVLGNFGVAGHQSAQVAEAARITDALARSAPTVTSWQVSVTARTVRQDVTSNYECAQPADQRIYVRDHQSYVYSYRDRSWHRLTTASSRTLTGAHCPFELQWAFAVLPARLATHRFTILPAAGDKGTLEGIRYSVRGNAGSSVEAIAWVDRGSGLLSRLEQVTSKNGIVQERNVAIYSYARSH